MPSGQTVYSQYLVGMTWCGRQEWCSDLLTSVVCVGMLYLYTDQSLKASYWSGHLAMQSATHTLKLLTFQHAYRQVAGFMWIMTGRPAMLMLNPYAAQVANFGIIKWCEKAEIWLRPCHMGTHLRVLSGSFPKNTNMTGFRWFSKIFTSLCFG